MNLPQDPLPLLDARKLRELGEHADGFRDTDMVVTVRTGDGGESEFDVRKESDVDADPDFAAGLVRKLMRVETSSRIPSRPTPQVSMTVNGRAVPPAQLDQVDALFLTESSIEKFLFPYYEQLRIFEPDYLDRLKAQYFDTTRAQPIVAIVHIPPSRGQAIESPSAIASGRRHPAKKAVHVLLDDPQAEPCLMPLTEFLAE